MERDKKEQAIAEGELDKAYDEAFDEASAPEDATEQDDNVTEEQDPSKDDTNGENKEGELSEENNEPAKEDDKKSDNEQKSKPEGELSGIEKALRDTKAWGTKISQENAELRATIEAYKKGDATRKDVEEAKDAANKSNENLNALLAKAYEDYPELQPALDPLAERLANTTKELSTLKAEMDEGRRLLEAEKNFIQNVEPEIKKVHSDFDSIKMDNRYFEWAKDQSPAMKHAAMYSLDPRDIIMAVTEFKKFRDGPQAEAAKANDEAKKRALREGLSGIPGRNSSTPPKSSEPASDDFDSAFDEAARKLK